MHPNLTSHNFVLISILCSYFKDIENHNSTCVYFSILRQFKDASKHDSHENVNCIGMKKMIRKINKLFVKNVLSVL